MNKVDTNQVKKCNCHLLRSLFHVPHSSHKPFPSVISNPLFCRFVTFFFLVFSVLQLYHQNVIMQTVFPQIIQFLILPFKKYIPFSFYLCTPISHLISFFLQFSIIKQGHLTSRVSLIWVLSIACSWHSSAQSSVLDISANRLLEQETGSDSGSFFSGSLSLVAYNVLSFCFMILVNVNAYISSSTESCKW